MAQQQLVKSVLGVHSTCYDFRVVENEPFTIDVPISAHIARWNLQSKQRVNTFELHEGVICSIQSFVNSSTKQHFIATVSYDGMLKIWNGENYNLLCQISTTHIPDRIDWRSDGKQLVVHIKESDSSFGNCMIALYDLECNEHNNPYSLKLRSKIVGAYRYALFNAHHQILAFNTSPNIIELLSKDKMAFIGAYTQNIHQTWTCAISKNYNDTKIAIATSNKQIAIIDATSLELLNTIKHKDLSPNVWCIEWNQSDGSKDEIIFSSKHGCIEVWDTIKCELKSKYKALSDFIYVLKQTKVNKSDYLCIATSDSLFMQSMDDEKEKVNECRLALQYHTITCCGIDLSFDENGKCDYIAVGDLGCSLFIWPNNEKLHQPLVRKSCVMSVRSIKWIPQTNIIFVGSMDGSLSLYRFDLNDNDKNILPVIHNCDAGITCIEYKHQYKATCQRFKESKLSQEKFVISVGTNGGKIFIFEFDAQSDKVKLLHDFLAHPPVKSDDEEYKENFGSIHKAADVWTCVFSPCGKYLGTASEDQSTKIWDVDNGCKLMETLKGHSSAVTCIDWTYLSEDREIFSTCADDRTVMIWKPKQTEKGLEWNLVHTFSTPLLSKKGWFTFTYLRFVRDGKHLICGTENGYIVVFDMDKMKQVFAKCLHRGSVEGLECNKHGLSVSVSSDCTIVLKQIDNFIMHDSAKSLL